MTPGPAGVDPQLRREGGYEAAVAELEGLGIMPERAPSLEPMRAALARSGLLPRIDPARVIVVAGTNGKGSVSATLAHLLAASGRRVGLYTSPHLVDTTERLRIAGQDISREAFARAYAAIRPIVLELGLSHFEALTLLAAWVFFSGHEDAGPPVEWAVLEVGLGGAWDATNAIPHSGCVITALGQDHENLLGPDLVSIARNKFGIVTAGATVVHSPFPAGIDVVAQETRSATGSSWRETIPHTLRVERPSADKPPGERTPRYFIQTPWGEAELALAGARGAANTATALTALETIAGISAQPLLPFLRDVRWPGRMERWHLPHAPCPVYLSGDHNAQGIQSLLELLPDYPRRQLRVLAGVGRDKDLDAILGPLFALPDAEIWLTETSFRGRPLADYGRWLGQARFVSPDPCVALQHALTSSREGDLVLVTGSLYLIGHLRRHFTEGSREKHAAR